MCQKWVDLLLVAKFPDLAGDAILFGRAGRCKRCLQCLDLLIGGLAASCRPRNGGHCRFGVDAPDAAELFQARHIALGRGMICARLVAFASDSSDGGVCGREIGARPVAFLVRGDRGLRGGIKLSLERVALGGQLRNLTLRGGQCRLGGCQFAAQGRERSFGFGQGCRFGRRLGAAAASLGSEKDLYWGGKQMIAAIDFHKSRSMSNFAFREGRKVGG